MQINEAFRRIVVGHLRLLLVCVLAGAAVALFVGVKTTGDFRASSRVQASSETVGSDTEADSVLNRVRGVATSPDIVAAALKAADITGRSAENVAAHEVSVTRLGSSAVVDIAITDHDRDTAIALATAVADQVVGFLRGPGSLPSQSLLDKLGTQQQQLYSQRSDLVAQLAATQDPTKTAPLSAQISTIDQQLADIAATVRQLQVAAATDSSATVISHASDATRSRSDLVLRGVLGTAAGLVLGLLLAALVETVRPRVADARAFARELDVPMLGHMIAVSGPTPAERREAQMVTPATRRRPWSPRHWEADRSATLNLLRAADKAGADRIAVITAGTSVDVDRAAKCLNEQFAEFAPNNAHPESDTNGNSKSIKPAAWPTGDAMAELSRARGTSAITAATMLWTPAVAHELVRPRKVPTVVAFDAVEPGSATSSTSSDALVVIAAPLASHDALRGIADTATATGWPLLGVLHIGRGGR